MEGLRKTFEGHVGEMSRLMVAELKAHEGEKGGAGAWLDGDPVDWLTEARRQLDMLDESLLDGTPDEVRKRAAHTCNFVMMTMQTEMAAR